MRISLRTRVSIFVAVIIIAISALSTYFYIYSQTESREKRLIARGEALSSALSKSAEEGLATENLDLIKKASYIVRAEDVMEAHVFSTVWEAIDAFPFTKLKEPPHPDAVNHFKYSEAPFYIKAKGIYEFYRPIFFKPLEDSPPITIGFVRLIISTSYIQKDVKKTVITNLVIAGIITIFAIISINYFVGVFIIKPITSLHGAVSKFKNGIMPDIRLRYSADELKELAAEFSRMCLSIKEKEERLIDSGKRIKSLFERVEHGIFVLDKNGNIIETNSRFDEMFGNVNGLCEILIGEERAPDCLHKAVADKVLHIEEKAIGRKGDELTALISLYPEIDQSGNVTGFDGYIIDITEKKRLEERLLRAQKLEAVGTLAGGIAHDFNNLLAAILGYSEIMLGMTNEGDPFYKPVSIIHNAAERGAELTKKILTVTRKEKMETKPVDINETVNASMELLQRGIPKNIDIVLNLKGNIPKIMADPTQIQQVIMNLAINARDAMPEGGKLTVETSVVGIENGAATNLFTTRGGFVKLSVSDTGMGIDKETQSKIFDPFFTTKETGKGTGLGLYIIHSIINNHGGYINLYSEPKKGTRFNVYLPITKASDTEDIDKMQDLKGFETILIIDDEQNVRELCRDMLGPLGYEVLFAGGGNEGVQTFREMKDKISLVILDMIMPKMSGAEVFQALKTIKPDVKVLLCSGYSQNGFAGIDKLLGSGASGFIQKPFTRQNIAHAIRKAIMQ
jgi:signal transduction histidine kinase/ActR/RegA family two-component response regulator